MQMNEIKTYIIIITGRVQGVGFRHSARSNARYHGIRGFIKNMSDESVYIEAEGPEEQLQQFIAWCRKGPGYGRVENLHIEKSSYKGFSDFIIKGF